jgi:hypothetical protein
MNDTDEYVKIEWSTLNGIIIISHWPVLNDNCITYWWDSNTGTRMYERGIANYEKLIFLKHYKVGEKYGKKRIKITSIDMFETLCKLIKKAWNLKSYDYDKEHVKRIFKRKVQK